MTRVMLEAKTTAKPGSLVVVDATPVKPLWHERDAIELATFLDSEYGLAGVGWHVAIAGGVMRRGWSMHDLDLVVYPHCRTTGRAPSFEAARDYLRRLGWRLHVDKASMHKYWRKKGSKDRKHVEVWHTADGRRVDLLVLS